MKVRLTSEQNRALMGSKLLNMIMFASRVNWQQFPVPTRTRLETVWLVFGTLTVVLDSVEVPLTFLSLSSIMMFADSRDFLE